jgi:parvulin-like peptidyl-prolyl isomerase
MDMKLSVPLLLGVSLLLGGCGKPASPDKVAVTVNGTPILEKQVILEIDGRINAEAAQDAARGLIYDESSRKATSAFLRDDVLHMMIERRLIADQLRADKIEITGADVDARFLKEIKEREQTPEQAGQEIKKQGETIKGVKEGFRQTLGVERLYAAHAKGQKDMTEAEGLQIYAENPHYFEQPEERRVSRILIRVAPDAGTATKAAAKDRAAELLKRVLAGEDFTALAKTYSEDNVSKARGGDRGWSPRGWITSTNSDPFGNVAFAMKNIGDISGVVETQDGYDIIKLTGLREPRQKSFDEVKRKIIRDAKIRAIGNFWNQFGNDLWAKAKIEWSPEELDRQAKKEKQEREYVEAMDQQTAREQAEGKQTQALAAATPDAIQTNSPPAQ